MVLGRRPPAVLRPPPGNRPSSRRRHARAAAAVGADRAAPSTIPCSATTVAGLPLAQPDRPGRRLRQDVRAPRRRSARWGSGTWSAAPITREPRAGNPQPRIVRYPASGAMVNAMGLPNPGARRAAAALARARPLGGGPVRQLADEAIEDALAALRAAGAARRRRRAERELSQRLVGPRPRQRGASARPRRPAMRAPFREADVREAPAVRDRRRARRGRWRSPSIAHEAGASGLTCSNTRPVREPRMSTGRGGLSGRALVAANAGDRRRRARGDRRRAADQRLRRDLARPRTSWPASRPAPRPSRSTRRSSTRGRGRRDAHGRARARRSTPASSPWTALAGAAEPAA